VPGEGTTVCERKGEARYVDVVVEGVAPTARDRLVVPEVSALPVSDWSGRGPFEAVTLDGERMLPQPGVVYGGWITVEVVGPFKGGPGSCGWW